MKIVIKHKNLIEKFILDERFILNEADQIDPRAQDLLDTNKLLYLEEDSYHKEGIIPAMLEDLAKQIKFCNDNLKEEIKLPDIDLNANLNDLIKSYKELVKYLETLLPKLKQGEITINGEKQDLLQIILGESEATDFEKKLNNFKTALAVNGEPTDNTGNVKDNNDIEEAELTKINNAYKDLSTYPKILADRLNKIRNTLPENLDLIELKDDIKELIDNNTRVISYLNAGNYVAEDDVQADPKINLTNLTNLVNNVIKKIDIKQILDGNVNIQEDILDLCEATIKSCLEQSELLVDTLTTGATYDWDEIFTNAIADGSNMDQLWEKYYKTEFPGAPTKYFDPIKKVLKSEIVDYGFTENKNPFVQFLKLLIKSGIHAEESSYSAINDAFVDNILSEADLAGNGSLGTYNIIFKPDFSKKDYTTALDYLKLQKKAADLFENNNANFRFDVTANKYDKSSSLGLLSFLIDLFFEPGNVATNTENRTEGNSKNKLKSTQEIERELKLVFGKTALLNTESKSKNLMPVNKHTIEIVLNQLKNCSWMKILDIKAVFLAYLLRLMEDKDPTTPQSQKGLKGKMADDVIKTIEEPDLRKLVINYYKNNDDAETLVNNYLKDKAKFKSYDFENATSSVLRDLFDKLIAKPEDSKK